MKRLVEYVVVIVVVVLAFVLVPKWWGSIKDSIPAATATVDESEVAPRGRKRERQTSVGRESPVELTPVQRKLRDLELTSRERDAVIWWNQYRMDRQRLGFTSHSRAAYAAQLPIGEQQAFYDAMRKNDERAVIEEMQEKGMPEDDIITELDWLQEEKLARQREWAEQQAAKPDPADLVLTAEERDAYEGFQRWCQRRNQLYADSYGHKPTSDLCDVLTYIEEVQDVEPGGPAQKRALLRVTALTAALEKLRKRGER